MMSPLTTPMTDEVWLLQNKLNPFPVRGQLRWSGVELSLTMTQATASDALGWVARRLDLETDVLKQRLGAGAEVDAFRFAAGSFEVSWPKSMAGAAMQVESSGSTWLISMDYPSGGAILQTLNLMSGRKKGKLWKAAFAPN